MAYNDNLVAYGSQVVTIGATAHVAESISVSQPTQIVERRDQLGAPTGQVVIPQFDNGTATLQLASTATVIPAVGATFTFVRNDASTMGVVVSGVSEPQSQFDIHKVTVNFRRRYGT